MIELQERHIDQEIVMKGKLQLSRGEGSEVRYRTVEWSGVQYETVEWGRV